MSEKRIERIARHRAGEMSHGRTDWARLRAMTEDEIDEGARADADNPPMTEEELTAGGIVLPTDRRKVPISIRMDERALERFKAKGPRYQTRLNDLMVADSENRVLILDETVAASVAGVKNGNAVLNAILREHAPKVSGVAAAWKGGAVVERVQRVTAPIRGGWIPDAVAMRLGGGKPGTSRHAS